MNRQIPEPFFSKIKQVEINETSFHLWSRELALRFLMSQDSKDFVILGGDVVKADGAKYSLTYDNWFVTSRDRNEAFSDYSKRSVERSLEYIKNYSAGEEFFFNIVISTEPRAGF